MKQLTLAQAANAIGAAAPAEGVITSVCTDTRKIMPGCIFFALKGENFDGHTFAAKALELGARAVVCESDCSLGDKQLLVKSTRQALLDLAGYYRRLFDIPVVGITGSVGKTTTKEMTCAVLSSRFKTLKNEGNLNNEIGVPLTLFRLEDEYEAAVIEMGMSGFGEMANMTAATAPTAAIISNIGVSHIEKLGSRENILKAKLEILGGMSPNAPVILNGDDDMLVTADTGEHPAIYYGIENEKCNTKAYEISSKNDETEFTVGFGGSCERVCLPSRGRHNISNALAAITAGILLGIPLGEAARALHNYEPAGMRQRIKQVAGFTVIEDCYNSSPDSQTAALRVLADIPAKRRIVVLGDMLELGEVSVNAHRSAGDKAADNNVDILLTYGKLSFQTACRGRERGINTVEAFTDKLELIEYLKNSVREGDAVLFKASRAMKLEEVIYALYDAKGKD